MDKASGQDNNANKDRALEKAVELLSHRLDRHRCMFLYTCYAYRIDPSEKSSRGNVDEMLPPKLSEDDSEGEFLMEPENRRALDDYVFEVYRKFGEGQGSEPYFTVSNAAQNSKTNVTSKPFTNVKVKDGSLPAWRLWAACLSDYLRRTTKAVMESVCEVKRLDVHKRFTEITDMVNAVIRPKGHPTWQARTVVDPTRDIPYEYPGKLAEVIAKVGDAVALQKENPASRSRQPATKAERRFKKWSGHGDACFIVDYPLVFFHYKGKKENLRYRTDSHGQNLFYFLVQTYGSIDRKSVKQLVLKEMCKSKRKPSEMAQESNCLNLSKKLNLMRAAWSPRGRVLV